ncbi:MAG TPA: class I SAM-dependent methyltransferase [Thermoanaerobaculia bacterium]|nr:class I SAM-dependent methyltransferase [Thermoanaerobaculia bacterium]
MTERVQERTPIATHPTLRHYYADDQHRQQFVNDLFDSAAFHYDRVERFLSLGSGAWYRAEVLRRTGLREGMRVIDIASGTGLVARTASQIVGQSGLVVGIDPSRGMLSVAQQGVDARFVQAVGEAIAVRSGVFDFLTMGYALRHVSDLRAAFSEYHRVLKSGGQLVIMELTVPRSRMLASLLRLYMSRVIPAAVRWRTGSRDAERMMRYYWDTTASCVPPETILEALRAAGFRDVRRDVQFGMFSEYRGTRA